MPARLQQEAGFGLVEMLIAITVLNIGIFAILAAFSSGIMTLQRANRTATAATVADAQMERMRAVRYCDLWLSTTASDATYNADPANTGTAITSSTCATGPAAVAATARTQSITGADGRAYRVDTYVTCQKPPPWVVGDACNADDKDAVKGVTLVVRDPNESMRVLTRQSSTFHRTTG